MTRPTLNQGQQAVVDGFFNHLFTQDPELIISGPGGTGKTFLMGVLIDEVMPKYHEMCRLLNIPSLYNYVDMTATTNKAAEELGKSTNRPTGTAANFLGLRVYEDYSTGRTTLEKTDKFRVQPGRVVFIDEAYTADSQLLRYVREGLAGSKVVFVGDHCQLAPVGEKRSRLLGAGIPFFELEEPVRNSGQPALVHACLQLRETVKTGRFSPIKLVPGVVDLLDSSEMESAVRRHFRDPANNDRVLAYSNKKVIQYNDFIREARGLPDTLVVGERVINNATIKVGGRRGVTLRTEDEFEVTRAGPSRTVCLNGVDLEVQSCSLIGKHVGAEDVPVAVNKAHFGKLLKYYRSRQDWTPYYELKNNFPDLRGRDAATVHKAQGSTTGTVFVDLDDLSSCPDADTVARLLYVSFSRARHRVVLYGSLSTRYGGITT